MLVAVAGEFLVLVNEEISFSISGFVLLSLFWRVDDALSVRRFAMIDKSAAHRISSGFKKTSFI